MAIMQSYNNKINAWVKYKKLQGKPPMIMNVKEREPTKKFMGVPVKRKR